MKVVDQRMLYSMYCLRSAPIYTYGGVTFFTYDFNANVCYDSMLWYRTRFQQTENIQAFGAVRLHSPQLSPHLPSISVLNVKIVS